MKEEINQYLTEAIGEEAHLFKVHGSVYDSDSLHKCSCGFNTSIKSVMLRHIVDDNNDFTTWAGFGKLWEWATMQEWWCRFVDTKMAGHVRSHYINPTTFATAVASFLKGE